MRKGLLSIGFVVLVVTASFASVTVKLASPASGTSTTSPVAISASASSTYGNITGWKIYVDGSSVYSRGASSGLSTTVSMASGSHSITVKAWDGSGANGSAAATITVSGTSTPPPADTTPTGTTFSSIEARTGWKICSGSCSGGGSGTYYMKQGVSSPSLDGASTEYHISPSTSFYDLMWYIGNLTNSSAANFQVDIDQYLKSPSAPQAIEYGLNQMYPSGKWYKFSTQCSFAGGYWRVWDSYNKHWVTTTAPCKRPAANTWTHYTFQYKRYNGKAVFVSITVNGQTYYINKSFSPESKSGTSGMISVHYQLDGNSAKTAYSAWVDRWTLKIW